MPKGVDEANTSGEAEGDAVEDVMLAHHELVDAGAGVQLLGEHPDDHRSADNHIFPTRVDCR